MFEAVSEQMVEAKVDNRNIQALVHSLEAVVDAAALSLHDRKMLIGLAQSSAEADSGDEAFSDQEESLAQAYEVGAPDPAAYRSHSESIIDVLEDLKQKAEGQLSELRKEEVNAKHNFNMLKQSITDEMSADKKELD